MGVEVRHEAADDGGFSLKLFEGKEAVARLEVGKYTMSLAGGEVTMGGVAGVVTHPAHRGKGFGAQMLRAAVARMREERYPVSVLWGISDFYHRFGYAPVLPGYTLTVATRHAERLVSGGSGVDVRVGGAADAAALLDLYQRANAGRSGTLRRKAEKLDPTAQGDAENWWRHARRILIAEEGGQAMGYVLLHGDPAHLRVLEVSVPSEHVETAGRALIAALGRDAVERRVEEIRLPLPPDEPLAQLLRRAGCKVEVNYPANGGGMGRIVDLAALGEAIQPAVAGRAAALGTDRRRDALELTCVAQGDEPEQRATLRLGLDGAKRAGHSAQLRLPQQQLCQLLMGYHGIDTLRRERRDGCAEEDVSILRALFPEGYPHMWSIDHF